MSVAALRGPDAAPPVHKMLLVSRQAVLPRLVKAVTDFPHPVGVFGVSQRIRALPPLRSIGPVGADVSDLRAMLRWFTLPVC